MAYGLNGFYWIRLVVLMDSTEFSLRIIGFEWVSPSWNGFFFDLAWF